jgi:hypothetical protein
MKITKVYIAPGSSLTSARYVSLATFGKITWVMNSWEVSLQLKIYHKEELTFFVQRIGDVQWNRILDSEFKTKNSSYEGVCLDYSRVVVTRILY